MPLLLQGASTQRVRAGVRVGITHPVITEQFGKNVRQTETSRLMFMSDKPNVVPSSPKLANMTWNIDVTKRNMLCH